MNDSIIGLYKEAIDQGITQGVFRDHGLEAMLMHGGATIGGALRQALAVHAAPKDRDEASVDDMLDFILRGFGCPEARLREGG